MDVAGKPGAAEGQPEAVGVKADTGPATDRTRQRVTLKGGALGRRGFGLTHGFGRGYRTESANLGSY